MIRMILSASVDACFIMSGLLFAAGLIATTHMAQADGSTSLGPFCGTPPLGSTDCPNAPACITGTCVIALKSCYCNQ